MRKENEMKKAKKILTLILIAVLCLSLLASLAGCDKNKTSDPAKNTAAPTDNNGGGKSGEGGRKGGSATPQPDTYVYNAKFIPVEGLSNGLNPLACQNGRILGSSWEKIGENIPEGVTPEWEGQYYVYGRRLYSLGLGGSVQVLEGYQPMETE